MAISPTDRNESLQCVACAVRQQRGQAITERDLANAILDWDNDSLEYSIVNSIGITVEMENEIKSWTKKWELGERNNKQQKKREYDNWIKSSILVANNLANNKENLESEKEEGIIKEELKLSDSEEETKKKLKE